MVFVCNLLGIGRWSELSVDIVFQEHEVMKEADANDASDDLGFEFGRTRMGLRIRSQSDPLIMSAIILSLVWVDLVYHGGWYMLKSFL